MKTHALQIRPVPAAPARRVHADASGRVLTRSGGSRPGNLLVGCLAAFGVVAVLAIIAGVILGPRIPGLLRGATGEAFRAVGEAAITESDLPADEKPDMIGHVNRVADGLADGSITFEQFGTLGEDLFNDNIFWVGMVYTIDTGYVQDSTLTDDEKTEGQKQLRRFAQGIHEGMISFEELKNVAAPIGSNDDNGNFILNEKAGVTDDQLQQVIANAKRVADEYAVPEEPALIDLSDEFGRVIDESLGIESGPVSSEPATDATTDAADPADDDGP